MNAFAIDDQMNQQFFGQFGTGFSDIAQPFLENLDGLGCRGVTGAQSAVRGDSTAPGGGVAGNDQSGCSLSCVLSVFVNDGLQCTFLMVAVHFHFFTRIGGVEAKVVGGHGEGVAFGYAAVFIPACPAVSQDTVGKAVSFGGFVTPGAYEIVACGFGAVVEDGNAFIEADNDSSGGADPYTAANTARTRVSDGGVLCDEGVLQVERGPSVLVAFHIDGASQVFGLVVDDFSRIELDPVGIDEDRTAGDGRVHGNHATVHLEARLAAVIVDEVAVDHADRATRTSLIGADKAIVEGEGRIAFYMDCPGCRGSASQIGIAGDSAAVHSEPSTVSVAGQPNCRTFHGLVVLDGTAGHMQAAFVYQDAAACGAQVGICGVSGNGAGFDRDLGSAFHQDRCTLSAADFVLLDRCSADGQACAVFHCDYRCAITRCLISGDLIACLEDELA